MADDPEDQPNSKATEPAGQIEPTRWTLLIHANSADLELRNRALAHLYEKYRAPLIRYLERRWPVFHEDAEDLWHDFMAKLIEKNYLREVDRKKGKFRSFLLVMFSRFLRDEWVRRQAARRQAPANLPVQSNENSDQRENDDAEFDYEWALHMVDTARRRLRRHYEKTGRLEIYDALRAYIAAEATAENIDTLAKSIGKSPAALKSDLNRLRGRYREFLREEVAETLGPDDDIDEEIRHLVRALSSTIQALRMGSDLEF